MPGADECIRAADTIDAVRELPEVAGTSRSELGARAELTRSARIRFYSACLQEPLWPTLEHSA